MNRMKVVVLLMLSALLILLVAQNTALVETHFLWITVAVPAIALLFVTAAAGFVAGLLVALLTRRPATLKR